MLATPTPRPGLSAYRVAFGQPRAALGPQPAPLARAPVWILPSPSGLNAHYTPDALAALFRDFRLQIESEANDGA